MEFSLTFYLVTIIVVSVEGFFSILEGTFSRLQNRNPPVRLTFLWHWGVSIGDWIILPIFNGIIFSRLDFSRMVKIPFINFQFSQWLFFPVAAVITWYCHKAWWPSSEKALNFMCPNWKRSGKDRNFWYRDMTIAGWIHFVFMIVEVAVIAGYIFTPMPKEVVWRTFFIFLAFIPLGVIEPGVVEGWPLSTGKKIATAGTAIALWSLLTVVTWAKL